MERILRDAAMTHVSAAVSHFCNAFFIKLHSRIIAMMIARARTCMADAYMAEWHDARGETAEAGALRATLRTNCAPAPRAAATPPSMPLPTGDAVPDGVTP